MQRRRGPSREGPRAGPRPNELSDMGRVNATPIPTVRAGQQATGARPRIVPTAASARVLPRWALAIGGGILWFIVSTVAELARGGPDVDGPLFLVTLAVTCLAGAAAGRTFGDDVALLLGSVAGLVLSSILVAVEPAGHSPEDVLSLAIYIGVAVVLLSPIFRRLIAVMRRT